MTTLVPTQQMKAGKIKMMDILRRFFSSKHREFYRQCKIIARFVVCYHMPPAAQIAKRIINKEDEPTKIHPFTNEILFPPDIEEGIRKIREIQHTIILRKHERKYLRKILKQTYKLAIKIKDYYDQSAYRAIFDGLYTREIEEKWMNGEFHFSRLGNLYTKVKEQDQ